MRTVDLVPGMVMVSPSYAGIMYGDGRPRGSRTRGIASSEVDSSLDSMLGTTRDTAGALVDVIAAYGRLPTHR